MKINKYPNNLRQYRLQVGLRQMDVAKLIGLNYMDRLSRWENGQAMPNIINLFKLAELYEAKVEDLYQGLRNSLCRNQNSAELDSTLQQMSDCNPKV